MADIIGNMFGGFVLIAVILIICLFILQRRRFVNRIRKLEKINSAKDQLFSIIGHDLNNAISNIPPAIKIFRDGEVSPDEKAFLLDCIEENAQVSAETLESLLAWGKMKFKGILLNPIKFDASEIIRNKLKTISQAVKNKNLTVKNNISAEWPIYADVNHFKFIVRNLLSNAAKFSRHSGTIEIDAYRSSQSGFIIFSVRDHGVGIAEQNTEKIFDRSNISELGTANEEGNSIGLMLCKDFVMANGGEIWVTSPKGGGANFYVAMKAFNHSIAFKNNKRVSNR